MRPMCALPLCTRLVRLDEVNYVGGPLRRLRKQWPGRAEVEAGEDYGTRASLNGGRAREATDSVIERAEIFKSLMECDGD